MTLNRSVSSFIFIFTVGGDKDAGHQTQAAKGIRHHVAHNISIVVFASPDVATFRANNSRYRIINQRVEVFDARFLEFFFVFTVIEILKNILEAVVIFLRDSIFGGEPQILLCVESIVEAGAGEAFNAFIQIMLALNNTGGIFEIMN